MSFYLLIKKLSAMGKCQVTSECYTFSHPLASAEQSQSKSQSPQDSSGFGRFRKFGLNWECVSLHQS